MISVIIPVYNAEGSITETLQSIAFQTRPIDEVIIVNDGSSDNTVKVISALKVKLALNIRIIDQENAGPSKARNRGVQEAKGEWIAFLDADDVWEREKVEQQMKLLEEHPEYVLAGSLVEYSKIKSNRKYDRIEFSNLLIRNGVFTSTVIVAKKVLIEIGGFREDMKYSEDYNLWLKICKLYPVMVVNQQLVHYGGGKGSLSDIGLSSNMWAMEKGELSNFLEMYRLGYISLIRYLGLFIFSLSKFFRRKILKSMR